MHRSQHGKKRFAGQKIAWASPSSDSSTKIFIVRNREEKGKRPCRSLLLQVGIAEASGRVSQIATFPYPSLLFPPTWQRALVADASDCPR